ncbi:MAG: M56 family metallopeptidase [Vicinamibacterales bacterium]
MTASLIASDWMLRVSVLLAAGLLAMLCLRRATAAVRHAVLTAAVTGALLLPVLSLALPAWHLEPITRTTTSARANPVTESIQFESAGSPTATGGATVTQPSPQGRIPLTVDRIAAAMAFIWLAGAAVSLGLLFVTLLRLSRRTSKARVLDDGPWADALARHIANDRTLAHVALVKVDHPSWLFTWGLRRPRIVLPPDAASWSDARIAIVLAHELEHVRRGDWLAQVAAESLRAVAWFNPLAWFAASRLTLESEHACDDAVLESGVAPEDYASHLVDLARSLGRSSAWIPAPAMARPSSLERRVRVMLDTRTPRHRLTRSLRFLTVAAGIAVAAAVASVAAQSPFATVTGVVRDQLGGTVPKVTIRVVNTTSGAKQEVTSNAMGHFELVGLPAGTYTFSTEAMGFRTTEQPMLLAAGQTLTQNPTLQVGELHETITVVDSTADRPATSSAPRSQVRPATTCTAEPNSGGIKPPRKLFDQRAIYPPSMRGLQTEARVELQALIGVDGLIKQVNTITATEPAFEQSAIDAVRAWRFSSTLLNCVPVEVEMKVLVLFKPDQSASIPPQH